MRYDTNNIPIINIDSTIPFISDGYKFIMNNCKRYNTDVFQTRLAGKKVICMSGEEAAKVFYNNKYFNRKGAIPKVMQRSFMGEDGIQTLDGKEHINKKTSLMSLMNDESLREISDICLDIWSKYSNRWQGKEGIELYREAQKIMCETACMWAGVPLEENEIEKRSKEFIWLVDSLGGPGIRHVRGRVARSSLEDWMSDIVEQVRSNTIVPSENTPLFSLTWYRNINDKLIEVKSAAVDLINIIRPIVAISIYVVFGALALHNHPISHEKIKTGQKGYLDAFAQEIRRFFPLAPFTGAKVAEDFTWNQYEFKKDELVFLDIYGANHDNRVFENPEQFQPERFLQKDINKYNFIPQGGGDYFENHRCAGEEMTVILMKTSFQYMVNKISYKVPPQDLQYKLNRIPSIVESGFIINDVKIN